MRETAHAGEGITAVAPEEADGADLLLNLAYDLPPSVIAGFRRTALLDIDPGMSQTWFAQGDIELVAHDLYLTTGAGIAAGTAAVPDCGVRWLYAAPCVALEAWSRQPPPQEGAYTTVTHWWGEVSMILPDGRVLDNSKRASFLPYLPVAAEAGVELELAVSGEDLEDDARLLHEHGWTVTDPVRAAGTPARYRRYIARSRGEFSCAKPAYVELGTGWLSDRTVCFLAAGRPVIIQDTGPCEALDEAEGQGVFRFREPVGAVQALRRAEADYPAQCVRARELAEERFDARRSAARVLELCM